MAGQRKWIKYGAIGCGVLVLLALCCVGGGYFAVGETYTKPMSYAEGLFLDLRKKDDASALQRMSGPYQSSHDLAAFTAAVEQLPALRTQTAMNLTGINVNNQSTKIDGLLATPKGAVPFELSLISEDGHWYVSSLRVEGVSLP